MQVKSEMPQVQIEYRFEFSVHHLWTSLQRKRAVIPSCVDAHAAGQSRCRTPAASVGVAGSLMIYDCRQDGISACLRLSSDASACMGYIGERFPKLGGTFA
jgi:hypothetical protein